MIMNVDGTSLWNIAESEMPKVTGILVTRVTHSENRKSHSVGMAMRCRIDLIKSNPLQKVLVTDRRIVPYAGASGHSLV